MARMNQDHTSIEFGFDLVKDHGREESGGGSKL
jgi:hypothetical protein